MNPIIELKNVSKSYPDGEGEQIILFSDFSFSLGEPKSIAILGKSGSGKTTLLNIIGMFIEPDEGDININGTSVNKLKNKQIALLRSNLIGYIVQDFALIETGTVYQNIEIPLLYSKKKFNKKKRIVEVSEQFGINGMLNKKVAKLSGGERQRVAIARAVVNEPKIILADEPTGALDQETGIQIIKVLKNQIQLGMSLILVTHDRDLAESCDLILEIKNKQIVQVK